MRVWGNLEGREGAGLVHVPGDGDVPTLGVELDPLPAPGALEAALRGGRPPDVQTTPRRRDLNVGALVVRKQRARGVVGDAALVQAAVEVDAADAVAEDEAEGCAGGARGLEAAPCGGVGDGGPCACTCACGAFVDVVDPARPTRQLGGQVARCVGVGGAVVCDSASGRAEARVGARPGFELVAAVFARSHKSYCNAYFVEFTGFEWG